MVRKLASAAFPIERQRQAPPLKIENQGTSPSSVRAGLLVLFSSLLLSLLELLLFIAFNIPTGCRVYFIGAAL